MTPTPTSAPAVRADRRTLRFLLLAAVALVVAHLLDRPVFLALRDVELFDGDLERMLRVMGFLPLWMAAAAALALCDGARRLRDLGGRAGRRGALLLGSATAGGIVAELLKLVFRRERAWAHDGLYVFRPWTERPLSTGGLGLPSSHALVAFAAAAMLSHLFPRARWIWWGLAVGCAATRVATGAHFVSDVTVSALVSVGVAALLWRRWGGGAAPAA